MCQFCKSPIKAWPMTYCGKLFHWGCYDKLRQVAIRTGGIL